jgi:hypothetical protein
VDLVDQKDPKGIDFFLDTIEKAYMGRDFICDKETFRLEPTLVIPDDFQRQTLQMILGAYKLFLETSSR